MVGFGLVCRVKGLGLSRLRGRWVGFGSLLEPISAKATSERVFALWPRFVQRQGKGVAGRHKPS